MKKLFIFAIAAVSLLSCSDDNKELIYSDEISFNVEYPSVQTRATSTQFEAGDKVGVFLTDVNKPLEIIGNYLNNVPLEYNGSKWSTSSKFYWNEGTYNAYAYYPYDMDVSSVDNHVFNVALDQSTDKGYEQSDFLWATVKNVSASDAGIQFQMQHKMSRVMIHLVKGEGYEGEIPDDAELYIHNTVPSSTIDLSVGYPTKQAKGNVQTIHAKKLSNGIYTAIIVPQRIDNRVPLVEIIAGEVSYLYECKFQFKTGVQHNLNLVISKNPEQIKIELGGEIVGW